MSKTLSIRIRTLVMVLALLVPTLTYLGLHIYAKSYSAGAMDAYAAIHAAETHDPQLTEEGSPVHAANGKDVSTMNPYDHKICDHSLNFREAQSLAFTYNGDWASAVAHGGAGSCNHNNLPFKGYKHEACVESWGLGCGIMSIHG